MGDVAQEDDHDRALPEPDRDPLPDMTASEASSLADLVFHWDTVYNIWFEGGVWRAQFRGDGGKELGALSHPVLRELIRADYGARLTARRNGDGTGRTGAVPDELPGAAQTDRSDV